MTSPQKVAVAAVLVLVLAAAAYIVTRPSPPSGRVDPQRIIVAAREYTRLFRVQNLPVPETVGINDLIARGLLRPEDVAGLTGAETTLWLKGDPRDPRTVLMRARFPDGQDLLLRADGSVQQVPAEK